MPIEVPATGSDQSPPAAAQRYDGQFELIEGASHMPSVERMGFVRGLFNALHEQLHAHLLIVGDYAELQARLSISERTLALTRDHLLSVFESTNEDLPEHWREEVDRVRFVGARLSDAAFEVLKSQQRGLTLREIEDALNAGQFRFRTGTPLREIHAALLRQREAKRDAESDTWRFEPRNHRGGGTP